MQTTREMLSGGEQGLILGGQLTPLNIAAGSLLKVGEKRSHSAFSILGLSLWNSHNLVQTFYFLMRQKFLARCQWIEGSCRCISCSHMITKY